MKLTRLLPLLLCISLPTLAADSLSDQAALGRQLFFDTSLSKNRTQSCASCHNPAQGFIDTRPGTHTGGSIGDDGHSIGDRNAPTAGYARFSPAFHRRDDGEWVGGQFWDGRASTLAEQAGGPPLNPVEMGMPDKASVVARLKENPNYVRQFNALFGTGILEQPAQAYDAMTASLEAFEQSDFFAPFDSKYDRFLRGEAKLTDQEELGRLLFFSQQFTNCNQCHQLRTHPRARNEVFSNHEYRNIGTPANVALRAVNGADTVDTGLLQNPAVDDPAQAGKFKVPTLRNVAVTGPYMHNGVFKDLRTVVLFYDKYNNPSRTHNPETGQPWAEPEVEANLALDELQQGPALEDRRVDAIVAFLKTLTDQRYEHLLE
ncbi:cytochrome-c peroxidase [Marinobacterium weihaiense]|uniref:Methylamine utilization protein MauG n=1 Tax=Marinobacterium weihaiense TaxID=2851016 RepID=A0ABS6MBF0_9GAMM|nr:cytochrome c peroxidase [Marinobacterium weihaiense]MBV0933636.1 methylamine utilization protein MauG [Marinobacterium weihaiense]